MTGLRFAWTKYMACSKTLRQAAALYSSGAWPVDLPAYNTTSIIEIFIGKSTWHDNYVHFKTVETSAPDMVKWLDLEHSTEKEDKKIWGFNHSSYGFGHLAEWLKTHDYLSDNEEPAEKKGTSRKKSKVQPEAGSSQIRARSQSADHHRHSTSKKQAASKRRSPTPPRGRHNTSRQDHQSHSRSQRRSSSYDQHQQSSKPEQQKSKKNKEKAPAKHR